LKLQFQGERVLAVVAHPDDADLLCAGTLLRAREDGAAIGVCYLCQGEKGQPPVPVPDLPGMRRREALHSAEMIGAELFTGIFSDMTLADTEASRAFLVNVYRTFRPTLILAHPSNDYHTDHRAVAAIAEVVTWMAAAKGLITEGLAPLPSPPALWWLDTLGMTGFDPTLFIDISAYAELKERLLLSHVSQLSRGNEGDAHPFRDLVREQMQVRGREAGVKAAEAFHPYVTYKRTRAW